MTTSEIKDRSLDAELDEDILWASQLVGHILGELPETIEQLLQEKLTPDIREELLKERVSNRQARRRSTPRIAATELLAHIEGLKDGEVLFDREIDRMARAFSDLTGDDVLDVRARLIPRRHLH